MTRKAVQTIRKCSLKLEEGFVGEKMERGRGAWRTTPGGWNTSGKCLKQESTQEICSEKND
jgi:hypothetical protein